MVPEEKSTHRSLEQNYEPRIHTCMNNQFTMKEQGTHNGERMVSSINGVGKVKQSHR